MQTLRRSFFCDVVELEGDVGMVHVGDVEAEVELHGGAVEVGVGAARPEGCRLSYTRSLEIKSIEFGMTRRNINWDIEVV